MNPRTIDSYGGTYQNEEAVVAPVSEMDAAFGNRIMEDVAQATRAIGMTWFAFYPTTEAAPYTLDANAAVSVSGVWGNGSPAKPVIMKTATGVYTLTWPEEFDDALVGVTNMEQVEETQQVAFTFASGLNVAGPNDGHARVTNLASNVVTIKLYNAAGSLSDLGGLDQISGYLR